MHCTVCWPTALKVPKIFWLWEIHSKEAVSVLYHETFHDAKIVIYDLGEGSQAVGGAGSIATEKAHVNLMYDSLSAEMLHQTNFKPSRHLQPAVQTAVIDKASVSTISTSTHLTTVNELLYFSWLTPITNIGASALGAEITTLLAPPFRWA